MEGEVSLYHGNAPAAESIARAVTTDTNSADFGRISRNITEQSNLRRFVQPGFRFLF